MKNLDLKLKVNFNNIHEWPIMTRVVMIALICLIVFFIGYKWDIAALQKKLSLAETQEKDLKLQYENVIKKQLEANAQVIHFNEMRIVLTEWQKKLISYNDLPELLNQVLKIGNNNALYFSLFDPAPAVEANNYEKLPINIIAAANYHQFADFLSQIANLPWIVVIDNFTITNDNKDDVLGAKLAEIANAENLQTLNLTLNIYYPKQQTNAPPPNTENKKT